MLIRIFSSPKTLFIILLCIVIVAFAGSFFPHPDAINHIEKLSENQLNQWYTSRDGQYLGLVHMLGLFDIFDSRLFNFLIILLFLNTVICTCSRLSKYMKQKRRLLSCSELINHQNTIAIETANIKKKLQDSGFVLKKDNSENLNVTTYEKGIPLWWFSVILHAGIAMLIIGLLVSSLLSVNRAIYVFQDEPLVFNMNNTGEGVNKKSATGAFENYNAQYTIQLNDLQRKGYKASRMKEMDVSEVMLSTINKSWQAMLGIRKESGETLNLTLQPGTPARLDKLTVYLLHPAERFQFIINNRPVILKARQFFKEAGLGFIIESPGPVTLLKDSYSDIGSNVPKVATINHIPDVIPYRKDVAGELKVGEKLSFKGNQFEFVKFKEGCLLYFKYDPTKWLLWLVFIIILIGLFGVVFGKNYRIHFACEDNTSYLLISLKGIWTDKNDLLRKLEIN